MVVSPVLRILFSLLFASFVLPGSGSNFLEAQGVTVTISHKLGTVTPAGTIELARGDYLTIEVIQTNLECYTFNLKEIKPAPPPGTKALAADPYTEKIVFSLTHIDASAYEITVTKKPGAECKLDGNKWQIDVLTHGWGIGFGGAFTVDSLTDPVFSLQPATRQKPSGETEQGFAPVENPDQRDEFKLGSAAMVHLYHSDPDKFGRGGINWVPVTFGIGVNDEKVRYFIGSGIRFNTHLFLTVGGVLGSQNRLPNGLAFTTELNALAELPTKTDHGWFFSLSYTFLKDNVADIFKKKFAPENPKAGEVQDNKVKVCKKISGSVTNADGTPYPGKKIRWQVGKEEIKEAEVKDGKYEIVDKPAGKYSFAPDDSNLEFTNPSVECAEGKDVKHDLKSKAKQK